MGKGILTVWGKQIHTTYWRTIWDMYKILKRRIVSNSGISLLGIFQRKKKLDKMYS